MPARLFTEISEKHLEKFKLIKGALGANSNGEALEKMIDEKHESVLKSFSGNTK